MIPMLPLVTAAALCLGSCATPRHPDQVGAIREVIERTRAVNNASDVEGWVALFEDDAVYMPAGQPAVTSRDDLRAIASAGFSSWRSDIRITTDEIVVMGDWAFARARVTGTATPTGVGVPVSIDLKEIVIYRQQPDGAWKIARLISNTNGS
jgi:uncharacterized protein (TIGR02246 family)